MGSRSASARPAPRAAVPRAALGLLSLLLASGCHAPPDPETIADEVDDLCRRHCPLIMDCLTDPVPSTLEECVEACVDFSGYHARNACGTASRAFLRCQSELSCDEFSASWNVPLDAEGFPCVEERTEWSTCDPDDP